MELKTLFNDIADAIREKDGTEAEITASAFPARIRAIPSGGLDGVTVESITITAQPNKTVYIAGDTFDPTGMAVYAAFSNGQSMYVNHSSLTFDPSGPLDEGDTSVTVNFQWGIKMVSASQPISVLAASVFGVMWDYANSSPALTRLTPESDPNNLVNMAVADEPAAQIGNTGGSSPFDSYMPWAGMEERNIVDNQAAYKKGDEGFSRTDYDTMVYIPEFWYQCIDDAANGKRYWYISGGQYPNMERHPGSGKYISRYELCGCADSKSGQSVTRSKTLGAFRESAAGKGSGWRLCDYKTYCAVALLALVEFATWDLGHAIGPGYVVDGVKATGMTDTMAYHTGSPGSGTSYSMQYRGIENLYGNIWKVVDGILFSGDKVFMCDDPADYSSVIDPSYIDTGLSTPAGGGHVSRIWYSGQYKWSLIPQSTGGSVSTYTTDAFYRYDTGTKMYIVGDIHHGYSSGIAAVANYYPSSYGDDQVGARLIFEN